MKKIYPILALSILLVACGSSENGSVSQTIESGDLEAIRSMKTNLTNQLNGIETDLAALEAAIANLDTNENLPLVTTFEVQPQVFNHYLDLQGNVKTRENVLLYPEMAGTLLTVKVKKGARVSKGQILAVIDNGGMSNQLSQLKTQAALAQTTFERQAALWKQKIGSEIQYLQSKAQAEAQANAVLQLEKVLAKFVNKQRHWQVWKIFQRLFVTCKHYTKNGKMNLDLWTKSTAKRFGKDSVRPRKLFMTSEGILSRIRKIFLRKILSKKELSFLKWKNY